jgi:hypothetical protein
MLTNTLLILYLFSSAHLLSLEKINSEVTATGDVRNDVHINMTPLIKANGKYQGPKIIKLNPNRSTPHPVRRFVVVEEEICSSYSNSTKSTSSFPMPSRIRKEIRFDQPLSNDAKPVPDKPRKEKNTEPPCTATLTGGDGFIQIGNWRFGRVGDDNHFSFSSNNGRTSLILRSDGTVHGGRGRRTDWGLSSRPLTWTYNASNPNALKNLPNIKFGRSYVEFGNNQRLGTPDNHHLSMSFLKPCCGRSGIHTSDIWRADGTIHPGPRTCCGLGQLNTFDNQLPSDSIWFGDRFLQIGNFRIADIDGNHMSIVNVSNGRTAEIFRSDSTQHPGPRMDFNANGRAKCRLRIYEDTK